MCIIMIAIAGGEQELIIIIKINKVVKRAGLMTKNCMRKALVDGDKLYHLLWTGVLQSPARIAKNMQKSCGAVSQGQRKEID